MHIQAACPGPAGNASRDDWRGAKGAKLDRFSHVVAHFWDEFALIVGAGLTGAAVVTLFLFSQNKPVGQPHRHSRRRRRMMDSFGMRHGALQSLNPQLSRPRTYRAGNWNYLSRSGSRPMSECLVRASCWRCPQVLVTLQDGNFACLGKTLQRSVRLRVR
jgi:hypothetical protein